MGLQAFYLKYTGEGFLIDNNDIPTEEISVTPAPTEAPTEEPTAEPTDEADNPDEQTEDTPEPTYEPEETPEPVNDTPAPSQQPRHYTLTMHINEEALKQWQNAFETIDQLVYVLEHK